MFKLKNQRIAIPLVLIAGIFWSFGAYVVKLIDQPETVPWQYLFTRGIVIFTLLNIYLYLEEGIDFYKNYQKAGMSSLIGGIGLGAAMTTFIWSITNTTAAVTLLCLAAMPFITALLGFLFLKENISIGVWVSICIAAIGIVIMALGNTEKNSLHGLIFGLASAFGFSIFSVSLRWKKETPKFTTVAIAGLFCCLFSTAIILSKDLNFLSSGKNEGLFALHGTIVCLGLILYSFGSKSIPAAELTLLSLTEVIGGIFWVWLPWLGINEIPSTNTIIGGFFIFRYLFDKEHIDINLEWDTVANAEWYTVYRNNMPIESTTTNGYFDFDLNYETIYRYEVTASNISGESSASDFVMIETGIEPYVPVPPSNLMAEAGDEEIFLTWGEPMGAQENVDCSGQSFDPFEAVYTSYDCLVCGLANDAGEICGEGLGDACTAIAPTSGIIFGTRQPTATKHVAVATHNSPVLEFEATIEKVIVKIA